jgi:small subunit ribosomal protein S17
MTTESRGHRKVRTGRVISGAADKTIVVAIDRLMQHPLYGRVVRRRKKLHVHDENNDAHVGDFVEIMETRPMSKLKHWRLVRVIERAR